MLLLLAPDWLVTGAAPTPELGTAIVSSGDVDGDGRADVAVATGDDTVWVWSGASVGVAEAPDAVLYEDPWSGFGGALAMGDVDGDGYDDLVVGAENAGSDEQGAVYVYRGSAAGLSNVPDTVLTGVAGSDHFGVSVATADVDGDGLRDVIVGQEGPVWFAGRVFVFLGATGGLSPTASTRLVGEADYDYFGASVARAGDVDGDGYDDVIVGAYGHDASTGRAYVFRGSADGLGDAPATTLDGEVAGDTFGTSVAGAGDVDGDGYDDVVVGAPDASANDGRAYVYQGSPDGVVAIPLATPGGRRPLARGTRGRRRRRG